jgi:8-hydroxy-5-deazaflavin:NADPH oxidoreductase
MLRHLSLVAVFCAAMAAQASAETIAIIGTGTVANMLGPLWAEKGHTIIYGSRTPDADKVKTLVKATPKGSAAAPQAAAQKAGIVLLAVPGTAVVDITKSLGDLKGKIIIDATNVLVMKDGRVMDPESKESLAQQVQAVAPGASVVKAYNTMSAAAMKDQAPAGGHVSLPISGDDAAAKARVAALGKSTGLDPVDIGNLDMSRFQDQLGRFYVAYSRSHAPSRVEIELHPYTPKP